jgi:hypothetical protein
MSGVQHDHFVVDQRVMDVGTAGRADGGGRCPDSAPMKPFIEFDADFRFVCAPPRLAAVGRHVSLLR